MSNENFNFAIVTIKTLCYNIYESAISTHWRVFFMIEKDELTQEILFFDYLDAAVEAYKTMKNDPTTSFYDSVRRNKRAPKVGDVAGSDVLISKIVLALSLSRRIFVLDIRERLQFFKFDEIEKNPKFATFKAEIFKTEPELTGAECANILKQICNSIAHGDVIQSFDFKAYEEKISKYYKIIGTLAPKSSILAKQLGEMVEECCTLKFYYPSYFTFAPDGTTKVKRPKPVKKTLSLSYNKFKDLMLDLLGDENNIEHYPICYGYDAGKEKLITFDEKNGTQDLDLTPEQMRAFYDIYKAYATQMRERTKTDKFDQFAIYTAIQNVLLSDKFAYLKLKNVQDTGLAIPGDLDYARKDVNGLKQYIVEKDYQFHENNVQETLRAMYANSNFEYVYKEMLATQVVSMLELAEQNNLLTQIADCDIIKTLACKTYGVTEAELTQKHMKKTLSRIRNSIVHGNYINNVGDKIEIFDQVSDSDETLEHKFTIHSRDLEEVKDKCFEVFKIHKAELEKKESATTDETETKKTDESTVTPSSTAKREDRTI